MIAKECSDAGCIPGKETSKITEVYTKPIPRLACMRRQFVRDLVEMDFAEEFEVEDYKSGVEIGKKKKEMNHYSGNFNFAPEIGVSVYEGDRFARVYLKYDDGVDSENLEEVRKRLKDSGLVRRIVNIK